MGNSRSIWKRIVTMMLAFVLVFTSVVIPSDDVSAAPKAVKSVTLKIDSKKVTKKTVKVEKGSKKTIKVVVKPASAKKKVAYKTSKKSVATVSKKGVVTAKKAGTAKITVTVTGKNKKKKTAWVKVKVVNPTTAPSNPSTPNTPSTPSTPSTPADTTVAVTGVTATISSATISAGSSAQITASVQPSNATDKTLTYTSSNTSVATVNAAGAVVGIKAGTATITVKSSNGKTATVNVTVVETPAAEVQLDKTEVELTVTGTVTLKATVLPSNVSDKTITWTSEDQTVASVDQNGVVTGLKVGTTTIKATNAKTGVFATCEVTVKENSIVANGVTATVTNPYEDNAGTVYQNTVLVGDDMNVRVQVMKNGQPVGNANVTLTMKPLYGNSSGYFEIRDGYLATDANGYANFTIGLKSAYSTINAVSNRYQSYTVTATEGSSNQKVEITVKFGSIQLNGVTVENNHNWDLTDDIDPSDNAAAGDDGVWVSHSVDGWKTEEYVSSQKVSSNDDDHTVRFEAEPYLILPATSETAHLGDWVVDFPVGNETGVSGDYSVYNNASNQTTTTVVEEVPAGLRYITLTFDKLKLSKYTAMYIDLYSVGGANLFHKEVTEVSNQDSSQGIQVMWQTDVQCYIVVSLVSQGQVDVSNEGYVLTKMQGPWATTNDELTSIYPIENSVTWTDVTNDVLYETMEWTYEDATEYLPADSQFLNNTYKYSYRVPVYPYTGDAVITVKDANGKVKAYYLYPTVNVTDANDYTNVNELAPNAATTGIYAIHATEDEVTTRVSGILETNGNMASVDTQTTGMTALKATVEVEGLDSTELNPQNGGIMYTSVQWAPVPLKEEVEYIPEFYAIEGQTVVVTAQLYDATGANKKSDSGAKIKFTYFDGEEEVEITKAQQEIGGDAAGNTVTVDSFMGSTNEQGQVILVLRGAGIDYVKGLTAQATGYSVALSVEAGVEPSLALKKANIYWVDLGATFVDTAVTEEKPVRTTNFNEEAKAIVEHSVSEVGKTWAIGYLPVARSYNFDYTDVVNRTNTFNEFISVENVEVVYSKKNTGALEQENSVATVTSTVISTETKNAAGAVTEDSHMRLTGKLNLTEDTAKAVVFNFYDENGDVVSVKNIGQGVPTVNSTGLILTMEWIVSGMQVEMLTPDGISMDQDTDTTVYVKVTDNYGNKIVGEDVVYQINGGTKKSGKTNEHGIFAIALTAPEAETSNTVAITVADDISMTKTITYVNNSAKKTFGIAADTTDVKAVQVVGENQLKVYFTNTVNASTIRAEQFKFIEDDETVQYLVTAATISADDDDAVILTLDKNIENKTKSHTVSVAPYTATADSTDGKLVRGVTYELVDGFGQKLTGDDSYTLVPSENTAK